MMRGVKMMMGFAGLLLVAVTVPRTMAQESNNKPGPPPRKALGTVTNGNKTIIFAPANESDIDVAKLRTWSRFSAGHPQIARAIAYHPGILTDANFLKEHPDLAAFFQNHPDIQTAMIENPGDFEAIPPRPGE